MKRLLLFFAAELRVETPLTDSALSHNQDSLSGETTSFISHLFAVFHSVRLLLVCDAQSPPEHTVWLTQAAEVSEFTKCSHVENMAAAAAAVAAAAAAAVAAALV